MPMSMRGAAYKHHSKGSGKRSSGSFNSRGNYPKKQLKGTFKRAKRLPNNKVIAAMRSK